MKKRILALVLAVTIAAMSLPIFAFAATGVTYYDYDPSTKSLVEKTLPAGTTVTTITTGDTEEDIMPGWNLIVGNVTIPNYFFLLGEVYFILADGATLTTEGIGVELAENNGSFTIYAQSTGENMGQIVTTGCENAAGIGGGYGEAVGDIAIFGGIINAVGGNGGAGIGSGAGGSCGNISIFGGIINATGGEGGAGIGSGVGGVGSESACEDIALQGGIVNAVGGDGGAGIGSGDGGSCGYTTVVGGYVKAVAGGETADPISNLMTSRTTTTIEEENAQYINYEPVAAAEATCTEAGHAAYVIDHVNALYYMAFPFTADGLIGNAAALTKWDGYEPPLGHDYVCGTERHTCTRCDLDEYHDDYDGDYICDVCHAELLDDAKTDKRWLLQVMAKDKSAAVQSIANDYRGQIQAATTVADVLALYDAAGDAIRAQINKEEAAALALAKTNAIAALETAAGNELTEAMSGVLEAAVAAVNAAKTVDAVAAAKTGWLHVIELQKAKELVIKELRLKVGEELSEGMAAVLNDAIAAVNAATTEEEVIAAKEAGLAAIALRDLKDQAILGLASAAGPTPLSQLMAAVLNDAILLVNEAVTEEEVESAIQAGLHLIMLQKARDEGAAMALEDAKTASKAALAYVAGNTPSEAMAAILNNAQAAVDKATVIPAVIAAEQEGLIKLFAQLQVEENAKKQAELAAKITELKNNITNTLLPVAQCDETRAVLDEAFIALDGAASIEDATSIYNTAAELAEMTDGEFSTDKAAKLKVFTDVLADNAASDAAKSIAQEAVEAIEATGSLTALKDTYDAYNGLLEVELFREEFLPICEEMLASDECSDEIKSLLGELVEELNKATSLKEASDLVEEYSQYLILQSDKDEMYKELEALLPEAGASDEVKAIVENIKLAIFESFDSSNFDEILRLARVAVESQRKAEAAQASFAEANEAIAELNNTIKDKDATIAEKQEALDTATEQLNTAKAELETAKTDLETAKAKVTELEGKVSDQDEALKQAKQDLENKQTALDEMTENYNTASAELDDAKKALDEVKAANEQLQQDLAAANEAIVTLNDTIASKDATIAEKQAAVEAAQKALDEAKAKVTELEGTVSDQDEALKQAEQDIKDLQAEIDRLNALLDEDDPTDPTEPDPTKPTEPDPTKPTEPDPTKPTEPTDHDDSALGDANGDGAVNMKDILLMRKYLADMDVEYDAQNADVNGDGEVNMKDVLMLRKYLADMIDHLGA